MNKKNNNYLMNIGNLAEVEDENQLIDIDSNKFKQIMFLYESALKEVKLKMEIMQEELKMFSDYEPIEYISTRIKKPESLLIKLSKNNYPSTYKSLFEKMNDIAGIRIVCNFKSDVYKLVEIISNISEIQILEKKDYLKKPKKSGYMSYHIIAQVPVSLSNGTIFVKVEFQIRTLGMDFWASLEHKLKYKNNIISKDESKKMVKYARVINNIDDNMLDISNRIETKKKVKETLIEAADSGINKDYLNNKKENYGGNNKFNIKL